jgi:hypothetical protein
VQINDTFRWVDVGGWGSSKKKTNFAMVVTKSFARFQVHYSSFNKKKDIFIIVFFELVH